MKFMGFYSIKYRYSDILLKNINFIITVCFAAIHTYNCVGMVSVTSASRYVASTLMRAIINLHTWNAGSVAL